MLFVSLSIFFKCFNNYSILFVPSVMLVNSLASMLTEVIYTPCSEPILWKPRISTTPVCALNCSGLVFASEISKVEFSA